MKPTHLLVTPLLAGLAAAATLIGAPAQAQSVDPNQVDPGYAQQQQDYQHQQQHYQDAQSAYDAQKDSYYATRDAYDQARARFHREQDAYDARYGAGAFEHYYRDHREAYDDHYGPGAYDRDFGQEHFDDGGPRR